MVWRDACRKTSEMLRKSYVYKEVRCCKILKKLEEILELEGEKPTCRRLCSAASASPPVDWLWRHWSLDQWKPGTTRRPGSATVNCALLCRTVCKQTSSLDSYLYLNIHGQWHRCQKYLKVKKEKSILNRGPRKLFRSTD